MADNTRALVRANISVSASTGEKESPNQLRRQLNDPAGAGAGDASERCDETVVFGLPKFTWLNALKNSPRTCAHVGPEADITHDREVGVHVAGTIDETTLGVAVDAARHAVQRHERRGVEVRATMSGGSNDRATSSAVIPGTSNAYDRSAAGCRSGPRRSPS